MDKIAKSKDGNMIDHTLAQADEAIENAKEMGNEIWEKTKAKSQDIWDDAQFTGQKKWNQTKGYIQKNPVKALGIAALLGAVLAVKFFPRQKN
jgi:ElaB/YqjD/DUF883 family membrane-anchored ribosome-binding protein